MLILTVPLLFFPRFLIFLSDAPTNLTPLERFLSNQIGILLLALAAGCIMAVSLRLIHTNCNLLFF